MRHDLGEVCLRLPERSDADSLYSMKNDPSVSELLGGFTIGYSRADIERWIDFHAGRSDEALWVIADSDSDECVGHVGLYKLDHRVRSGEFAILIGNAKYRGRGIGKLVTQAVIRFGFDCLNLNRIELTVLATNERAIALYEHLGFRHEGARRQAQYKNGQYIDVVLMGMLRAEAAEA